MDSDEAVRLVFGMALHHLRSQAGLSLRALGQAAHYDFSRISRVERGEHLIDPRYVPALDSALGTGGLLSFLRSLIPEMPADGETPSAPRGRSILAPCQLDVGDEDTVSLQLQTPDGRTVQVRLSRRDIGKLLAGGALQAMLPAGVANIDAAERVSKALDQPRRVDPEVLDYFRLLLTEHFTADKMLGPRQMLGPVLAQIQILDELRRHARPGTTEPTLRLLTQYAEFAGWLHQDAGNTSAAMHWSDQASQWAQAIGDYQLVAYMLVRKSNIALLDGDAINVIDLAAAARKVPGAVSPKLHALAAQQEARGWALHGDASRFRRQLDIAANLLCDRSGDVDATAPIYLRHYDLSTLQEQSASGYRACGHAATAVTILEQQIAATPEHLHRDRGHQLVKLVNTVLATAEPDPERASDLGLSTIPIAKATGSARIADELNTLNSTLTRRWPTLPGTLALHEALLTA